MKALVLVLLAISYGLIGLMLIAFVCEMFGIGYGETGTQPPQPKKLPPS